MIKKLNFPALILAGVMTVNNVGFRFDVSQSNDKEIEFSRSDACPSDGSKNVSFRLDIDSDDTEVFDACRDDQEFLVDSGQNSETSSSCKVRTSEPDVSHTDDLERVGIGPKREAHNLCNTDSSDQRPQYTYTAADVTTDEKDVDIDGVIPQIPSISVLVLHLDCPLIAFTFMG